MGLPNLKPKNVAPPEPVRQPTLLERLDRIASKVRDSTVQPDVKAVRDFLEAVAHEKSSQAENKRANFLNVNRIGRETVSRNAVGMREDWTSHLIAFLVDNYARGRDPTRAELIGEIRGYCGMRRYTGKNGEQVKKSTIARWLTVEYERDIRCQAIAKMRS